MHQYAPIDLRDYVQPCEQRLAEPPTGPPDAPSTRYPLGVEVCTTPEQYYHVLRRSAGEICARFEIPHPSVLRYEGGEWTCYRRRAGRTPLVEHLDRAGTLAQLRDGRPVLVAEREVAEVLTAGTANTLGPTGTEQRRSREPVPASGGRAAGGRR